jgi:peptidoglycan/xylan/chitin deacetylase (PgdA/CDA1 family)
MNYTHNGYTADGHQIYRPAKNHPKPRHWAHVRRIALLRDGKACRSCWKSAKDGHSIECHHRHYDNWGRERPEDVVILCDRCHDLIKSDIRQARREFLQTIFPPSTPAPSLIYTPYYQTDIPVPSYSTPSSVMLPAPMKPTL